MWKAELVNNELEYLAEKISQQSVGVTTQFLLAVHSRMREQRDKLKEELFIKKEPGLVDLGNSQPVQIAKDAKTRRFALRNMCSGKKAKGVAEQSCANPWKKLKGQTVQSHG